MASNELRDVQVESGDDKGCRVCHVHSFDGYTLISWTFTLYPYILLNPTFYSSKFFDAPVFPPSRTPLAPRSSNHTLIAVKQEIDGPYVLDFGKHQGSKLEDVPADYLAWLKKQPHNTEALKKAIRDWDKIPRVYRLGFGMHRGCTLDEVPPAYITWLYENAADEYDDLREALAKHKRENSIKQVTAQKSKSSKKQKKPFYFGADATAMKAAGLEVFHKGQRFWVHQVFAYARHFGTTGTDTPTNALNKSKAKKYN
ncbi:hypothetical protein HYALB_00011048 [Hymenoscyphus albidus]|uniref:Uncharacterized protein n=1 Tax=Hymenoscyphus albidus TaxID=595503 RepID=A0A9N9LRZ3_9HELO|nr:hypothetical protein HYALB_00011048 [Hymenoscyphus albidus]